MRRFLCRALIAGAHRLKDLAALRGKSQGVFCPDQMRVEFIQ